MARLTLILGVLATVIYLLDGFRFMLNEWRNWRNKGKWLVVLALCLLPSLAEAACSGSSPTWATTNDVASIQACIDASVTGDTVTIESTTSNWGAGAIGLNGKNIVLTGGGIGQTVITSTASPVMNVGLASATTSRITGFTITASATTAAIRINGQGWRVDHVQINNATAGTLCDGVHADGLTANTDHGPTGLIDHVVMNDCRVLVFGFPDTVLKISSMYFTASPLGTANAVYIEDSQFTFTTPGHANFVDCNYGGSWVSRFNTYAGSSSVDSHSNQGERSCRHWEVYGTTQSFGAAYFTPYFIRGGTGMIFNNIIDGGWLEPYISFDNVRSFSSNALGQCDGTSIYDGNLHVSPAGDAGWPCRDQIGWNTDAFNWTVLGTPPTQAHEPAYVYGNTIGGSRQTVNIRNGVSAWIQPDRDYYLEGATFNGTSGVGIGALEDRPETCTTYGDGVGVGYWATNQGSWNTSSSNPYGSQANGADGLLYVCTATDTWTLYYTPYTYPHPLQGITDTPAASPVVIARVIRFFDIAVIVAGIGWHFKKSLMAVSLAAIAGCGTLYQLAPRSYETLKVTSKESAVKVLTVFNHLTKPRV
jgi:hypothetical protein